MALDIVSDFARSSVIDIVSTCASRKRKRRELESFRILRILEKDQAYL